MQQDCQDICGGREEGHARGGQRGVCDLHCSIVSDDDDGTCWHYHLLACRRMVETFVEVVRRGMQEGGNEVSVTYTGFTPADEDGEQADGDSEDLPDLMSIRDGEQIMALSPLL